MQVNIALTSRLVFSTSPLLHYHSSTRLNCTMFFMIIIPLFDYFLIGLSNGRPRRVGSSAQRSAQSCLNTHGSYVTDPRTCVFCLVCYFRPGLLPRPLSLPLLLSCFCCFAQLLCSGWFAFTKYFESRLSRIGC
jgi:hypothetical protein